MIFDFFVNIVPKLFGMHFSCRYLLIAPERALKGDNYSVTIVNNMNEDADVTLEMSSKGTSGIITEMIAGVVSAKSKGLLSSSVTCLVVFNIYCRFLAYNFITLR